MKRFKKKNYKDKKTKISEITFVDTKTNLEWAPVVNKSMTWKEAINFCKSLSYAGHKDWRMPNDKELESLIDRNEFEPASNFEHIKPEFYWSSSSHINLSNYAWFVNFYDGVMSYYLKSYSLYFIPVRGGK